MKKVDKLALSISLVLNLIILFLIPGMTPKEVAGKIKVGLVSSSNSSSQRAPAPTPKPPAPKPPVTPPPVVTPPVVVPPPVTPPTPQREVPVVAPPRPNLNDIAISQPKIDVLSQRGVKVPTPNLSSPPPVPSVPREAVEVAVDMNSGEGTPTGYRLGAVDGDVTAVWNPNNRNPEYPESAQNRGLNGRVSLRLTIDASGNITRVVLERRSGVPEIDLAIERVAKSWKINLTKNGAPVRGDVILEYDFRLTGN